MDVLRKGDNPTIRLYLRPNNYILAKFKGYSIFKTKNKFSWPNEKWGMLPAKKAILLTFGVITTMYTYVNRVTVANPTEIAR